MDLFATYAELDSIKAPEVWSSKDDPEGYGMNPPNRSGASRSTPADRIAEQEAEKRLRKEAMERPRVFRKARNARRRRTRGVLTPRS